VDESQLLSEIYSVDTTLVVGDNGSGKTTFCLNHPKRSEGVYIDLEDRYAKLLKAKGISDLIEADSIESITKGTFISCRVINDDYQVDHPRTFSVLQNVVKKLVLNVEPELIVIDGVSDLRRMATDKYTAETNKKAFTEMQWGQINDMVKEIIFPLINYCSINDKYLILTTLWEDEYEGRVVVGKKIAAKEYITSNINQIVYLEKRGVTFYIERGKSWYPPTEPIEITGVFK
jgi:hypothetical protein